MTTVRKVRHPITGFVIAVLVVIGVSVGVVASTTNQKVYGPPGGRFTVAFPGRVYASQGLRSVSIGGDLCGSMPLRSSVTQIVPPFSTFSYSNWQPVGWVAYAPLIGEVSPSDLRAVSVSVGVSARMVARGEKCAFFKTGVFEHDQHSNGIAITTIGPQCTKVQCRAAEVVSDGRVVWGLLAVSDGSMSAVEGFLASFGPIG